MSFVLGLIMGAGEIVGTTTTEVVGSETLGTIAGSTVAGELTGIVEGAIDTATSTVVDALFGPDAYENKKKQLYNSIEEAKSLGLFSGNIGSEKEILQTIKDSNYTENEIINQIHNYIHDFSDEVSKKGLTNKLGKQLEQNSVIGDIFAKLSQSNPIYYYLSNALLESFSDIVIPQNDPYYQEIATVYNGKGLYDKFVKTSFDGTNSIFSAVDEIGQPIFWNTSYNTYIVVPPIWGIWTGINSPNSSPPVTGFVDGKIRQSWLDFCAFAHDISYHDWGSFNKKGDYILISRISQNLDWLVFPGERQIGIIAVDYFSSLGAVARKLMGPVEEEPIVKKLIKDVYGVDVIDDDLERFRNTKIAIGDTNTNLINMINNLDLELD